MAGDAHPKPLLLLARHNASNEYWQTTPNKTRTVSHWALVKTQKASDSFVWAGFIASWFVTSPSLTSQLHLGLISHVLQDRSRKAFPIAFLLQRSSLEREHVVFGILSDIVYYFHEILSILIIHCKDWRAWWPLKLNGLVFAGATVCNTSLRSAVQYVTHCTHSAQVTRIQYRVAFAQDKTQNMT